MVEHAWGERRGLWENLISRQVTFPYTIINRELYVGLLQDEGKHEGKLCVPLTSIDPNKTHFQFKKITKHRIPFRRRQESKGLQPYKLEPRVLGGERMDINPALEVSRKFGTIEAYKLRLSGDLMRKVGNAANWEDAVYEINTDELIPVSLAAMQFAKCKFYHFSKVFDFSDVVTLAGFARLVREEVLPRFGNESSIF